MTTGRKAKLDSLFDVLHSKGWEPGAVAGWDGETTERNYRLISESGTTFNNLPLVCVAVEFLAAHQPDTVRGNMYLVVSAGWLPDTSDKSYNRLGRLLGRLRENGTIRFEWIVDTIRSTIKPSSWSGLADFAETVRDAYRKDFWASLPDCVEVIVEKDTLAGKVSPITEEYDVALHPIRGYSSKSFAHGIARQWRRTDKPITVYYIGDHDPSGMDLERDIKAKLKRYSQRAFAWVRLAVLPGQFEQFDIMPLAVKTGDKRATQFIRDYGSDCAEAEAIPANDLRAMLRTKIENHIPSEEWERLQRVEELERESVQKITSQMKANTP